MNIFNRKPTFTVTKCPECGGSLELDSNLETAHCKMCGMTFLVEHAPKKQKQGNYKLTLDFIERQQSLRRQDKIKKEEQRKEEIAAEKKQQEAEKKNLWIYLLVLAGIILFCVVMSIFMD